MLLIKLSKKGCAPCASLSKFLSENYPEVKVEEVDVESERGKELVRLFDISSVPILYDEATGLICSGFSPAKVRKFINEAYRS